MTSCRGTSGHASAPQIRACSITWPEGLQQDRNAAATGPLVAIGTPRERLRKRWFRELCRRRPRRAAYGQERPFTLRSPTTGSSPNSPLLRQRPLSALLVIPSDARACLPKVDTGFGTNDMLQQRASREISPAPARLSLAAKSDGDSEARPHRAKFRRLQLEAKQAFHPLVLQLPEG